MDSLVMIQPSLISYSFEGPPTPVLLDSSSLAPVCVLAAVCGCSRSSFVMLLCSALGRAPGPSRLRAYILSLRVRHQTCGPSYVRGLPLSLQTRTRLHPDCPRLLICLRSSPSLLHRTAFCCWTRSSTFSSGTERPLPRGGKLATRTTLATRTSGDCWRPLSMMPRCVCVRACARVCPACACHSSANGRKVVVVP